MYVHVLRARNVMHAFEALIRTSSGSNALASKAVLALASRAVQVQLGYNYFVQPMLTITGMHIMSSTTIVG